jgi:putative glutathione S-transferase
MALGQLIEGKWVSKRDQEDSQGRFLRPSTTFRDRITADGSSGFKAESGRYHLYISWACPWAHRTAIMRTLKGLEDAITLSVVDPLMGEKAGHSQITQARFLIQSTVPNTFGMFTSKLTLNSPDE